jgi:hypothetical protein
MSEPAAPAQQAHPGKRRGRAIGAWIALVVAALFLLLSAFAIWVNRVALDTDVFVDTSSELIADDEIRSAVATRAVDELYASVDVAALLQDRLPSDYQSLAGPAAAGVRQASYQIVDRALQQPRLLRLWEFSIEQSHETLVQVLEGGGNRVSTEEGIVTLDLRPIILDTADRIGLGDAVADRLPADAGRIEVLRSDELDTAQSAVHLLQVLAWLLPLLALLAFALAVWLAGDRRRAVRRVGVATFAVGILGLLVTRFAGSYVVDSLVAETENRAAASNAWDILTELLRSSFRGLAVAGVLLLVAAWLAGPGRRAVEARRLLAPFVRERVWAYGALAVVTLILLLTGPVGDFARYLLVLVLVALGALWIELMRRQTVREHPDASAPELFADARAKVTSWWEAQRARSAVPAASAPAAATPSAGADVTARLVTLAELHSSGALSDEEFASAKARVLAAE